MNGHRQIVGLKWARALAQRPSSIPVGRPRGAKRQGVKYERDFGDVLPPDAWHGKWFEFLDANGPGFCQPDFILRVGDTMVVLEAKYTWVERGHSQITELYKPVVEAAFGLRVAGIVVCKNLTPEAPKATHSLDEAIRWAVTGRVAPVLQWIAGPLPTELRPRHLVGALASRVA